jgi:hypothetical protein
LKKLGGSIGPHPSHCLHQFTAAHHTKLAFEGSPEQRRRYCSNGSPDTTSIFPVSLTKACIASLSPLLFNPIILHRAIHPSPLTLVCPLNHHPDPRPLTKPNPTIGIPGPPHRRLSPTMGIAISPTTTSSSSARCPRREPYPHLGRPRALHAGDGPSGRRHRPGLLLLDVVCPALDPGLDWWWWRRGVHTLPAWLLLGLRLGVVRGWVRGLVGLCGWWWW